MAKGGYMCIAYPDPGFSIQSVIDSIEKDGGAVAWILHDKDDCDAHFHILCMWDSSPMPWNDTPDRVGFLNWMIQHKCKCPKDNEQYCREVAVVKDIDSALAYMTHTL